MAKLGSGAAPWTKEENAVILAGHEEGKRFARLAEMLPGRSAHACRNRADRLLGRTRSAGGYVKSAVVPAASGVFPSARKNPAYDLAPLLGDTFTRNEGIRQSTRDLLRRQLTYGQHDFGIDRERFADACRAAGL